MRSMTDMIHDATARMKEDAETIKDLRSRLAALEKGRPSSNALISAARRRAKWLRQRSCLAREIGTTPTLLEDLADHIAYLEMIIADPRFKGWRKEAVQELEERE